MEAYYLVAAVCWPVVVAFIWLTLLIWKNRVRLQRYILWLVANLTIADAAEDWRFSPPAIPPARQRR